MRVGHFGIKQWSRIILILFYAFAGVNHFWHPEFYLPLIPDYLPEKGLINTLSGWLELLLALGMIFPFSRKIAVYGIIILLIAFIPSHVHFIQIGACTSGGFCTSLVVAWLRLLIVHPLLIWWVWWVR